MVDAILSTKQTKKTYQIKGNHKYSDMEANIYPLTNTYPHPKDLG